MAKRLLPYAYILPVFAILVGVLVVPSFLSILFGFFRIDFFKGGFEGVGLANFQKLLSNERFFSSMRVTVLYTVGAVVFEFLLGLGIALLLNRDNTPGIRLVRALVISPWVLSPVIVGLIWRMMFHANFGIVNYFLGLIWPPLENIPWLSDPYLALFANVVGDVWQNTPFVVMLLLAGLQVLPQEPYEAARVDGASRWQTLIYVTIPMLMPSILAVVIFRTIYAFREFTIPWTITTGGPGSATEVFSIYLYRQLLVNYDMGVASALGSIMLLLTTLLTFGMLLRMVRMFQQ